MLTRRSLLGSAIGVGLGAGLLPLAVRGARAAGNPKEIRIDWATYNPVSMVLKDKGLLEKEFAKDGISIVWVQTLGSNKALEFLNAGSIDFGSTAGSAALLAKINGNPIKSIYVYSRPEWTALVTLLLSDGPLRFSQLRGNVGRVAPKVLTQTLRRMERDGLITRAVYAEVPPRVEYALTDLGTSLIEPIAVIGDWAEVNVGRITAAQAAGMGIKFMFVVRNLAQLNEVYEKAVRR